MVFSWNSSHFLVLQQDYQQYTLTVFLEKRTMLHNISKSTLEEQTICFRWTQYMCMLSYNYIVPLCDFFANDFVFRTIFVLLFQVKFWSLQEMDFERNVTWVSFWGTQLLFKYFQKKVSWTCDSGRDSFIRNVTYITPHSQSYLR